MPPSALNRIVLSLVGVLSLGLTLAAWQAAREQARDEESLRFELRVQEIAAALRGRMLDYEQVLRGGVALFQASQSVEPDEWEAYIRALDLQAAFPGIRAMAYGALETVDGSPSVRVTFVAPRDEVNPRALGFNLYADPARRAAMERARDTAEPVMTEPVQLLRDLGAAPRPGFVMFLPVYRRGTPETLEARREQIMGFVYGSFRVREFAERTVGDPIGIRMRLLDVTNTRAPTVLYEPEQAPAYEPYLERSELIIVRGRVWSLEAGALPGFASSALTDRPRLVLAGGVAISMLLTMLFWSLLNTRRHARELARRFMAAGEELERFRAAVDSHQDTMLMVDAQKMSIVYANEGACRNLGYSREELIGQPPEIVFADRDGARLALEYELLKAGEHGAAVYRAMHKRKDGTLFPVEVSRELVRRPGGDYILGIARDITARLEAERALRESEHRLALAVESSGLALFDWDLRTGRVHMGAEWGAILGGEKASSQTSIEELERMVHPDDLPALRETLRRLLKGEVSSYRVEHRVRKGGDWIWIESVAEVSEHDAAGRALRVTGTNADITARRALAGMKAAFLANVSHELRTPLTGIVASLELLKEGAAGELPAAARKFIDGAHANGERLAALIQDLLDLERSESGRMRLEIERLDAGAELRGAASLNKAYAERYKARLQVDAGSGLFVSADRTRLQQVIANLISNAAKFSPKDGEIRLAARAMPNGRVVLSVADQGPGMPDEFKARLFGKFEQADHGKPGAGLGLAICKSLVERMGGRIWCESTLGKGTTLLVELPAA